MKIHKVVLSEDYCTGSTKGQSPYVYAFNKEIWFEHGSLWTKSRAFWASLLDSLRHT